MHPMLASTTSGATRSTASAVLTNIMRDIQLVKAQIGDDNKNLRFIRMHRAHVTLNGLISGAKEAFPDKDLVARTLMVQFRDSAGDFVTLRDDMEIQLLDLSSTLGYTVLKFIPIDESGQKIEDEWEHYSSARSSAAGGGDLQAVLRRLTNVENIVRQLSANFGPFRRQVLKDLADISQRLGIEPTEPVSQPSRPLPELPTVHKSPSSAEVRSLTNQFALLPLPAQSAARPENGSQSHAGASRFLPSPLVNIPTPPSIFPESGGIFAKFTVALNTPAGTDKMTLLGKDPGERMFVSQHILMRAVHEAELVENGPERGGEIYQFAKTILSASAEDSCGCSLQTILQDLMKAAGKDVVLAFCTSSGNRWMKVLHTWASARWPASGLGKNKFTQTMNLWIRAVCHGYSTK